MSSVDVRLCVSVIEFEDDLLGVFREIVVVFSKYFEDCLSCLVFSEEERCFELGDFFVCVSSVLVVLKLCVEIMKHACKISMSEDSID